MRGAIRLLTISFCFAVIVAVGAFGQKTGSTGSGGTKGGNVGLATRPSVSTTPVPPPKPSFFSGKVLLDTGSAPPAPVAILRYCNGYSRREGYTSSDGSFSFVTGDRFSDVYQQAQDDGSSGGLGPQLRSGGIANQSSNSDFGLMGCELKAELAGYTSSIIRLDPTMTNTNVGIIMLHSRSKTAEGMVTAASLAVPAKARKEFEKGSEELEKGNLEKAEKYLRKAIDEYAKFAEAWMRLGDLEQRRKNVEAATQDYREAISADPNLPMPYLRLAQLEAVAGHWKETRDLTDKVIALDPTDFPKAYFFQGVAEFNLKEIDKAERSALRAESMDQQHTEPRIELLLANIYVAKDSYSNAADHFRNFLKLVPEGPISDKVKVDLANVEQMAKAQAPAAAPQPADK